MARKKPVSVEIVRHPSREDMNAALERVIREKLDELLTEHGTEQLVSLYQPRKGHRRFPGFERHKYALYFEKFGCKVCGRKENLTHATKGRCDACHSRHHQRMARLEREWVAKNPESQIAEDIDHLTRRLRAARDL